MRIPVSQPQSKAKPRPDVPEEWLQMAAAQMVEQAKQKPKEK